MYDPRLRTAIAAASCLLAACAATPYGGTAAHPAAAAGTAARVERALPVCSDPAERYECDRRAILAMQGEYRVSFHFDETVALAPGYDTRPDKDSGGHELVLLVEDAGDRIVLQHLLVTPDGAVIKHWRQDWTYQPLTHWTYAGDQRFVRRTRTREEVAGAWLQAVYEVHDGPRYAGIGRWNHRYGVSTWTSERTWRPLPRREYTTRSDYDLLNVENRHTITPNGWTHEQDNTKVVRREGRDRVLVREFGFNDYRLVAGYDFSPARRYWEQTAPFWAAVRARWDRMLQGPAVRLAYPANEEAFLTEVLARAEDFRRDGDLAKAGAWLDARFAEKIVAETGPAPAIADEGR